MSSGSLFGMHQPTLVGFVAASVAIIVVPGPSVLVAASRAIVSGRRDGILIVLGNAMGLFVQAVIVAVGIGSIVSASDAAYMLLQMIGAAYLVWLGIAAIRNRHEHAFAVVATVPSHKTQASTADHTRRPLPDIGPWWDGLLVGLTNPKSFVFLAALLPRHAELGAAGAGVGATAQMIALGALFCLIAVTCDATWVMAASRARSRVATDPRHLARLAVVSGLVMIALGILLVAG